MARADYRRIKSHRCYTIEEAAAVARVSISTIRLWIRQGLTVIKNGRPFIIRGCDLKDFIRKRHIVSKRPCGLGEMFCFKCRAPQKPGGGMAEFVTSGNGRAGMLRALCEACTTVMNQRAGDRKRREFERLYAVEVLQGEDTLKEGG